MSGENCPRELGQDASSQRFDVRRAMCLATVLAIGVGIVWAIVATTGISTYEDSFRRRQVNESLRIQSDGVPIVEWSQYEGGLSRRFYRTLDGDRADIDSNTKWNQGVVLDLPAKRPRRWWEPSWQYRIASYPDNRQPLGYWFFMSDDVGRSARAGYFVGYDSETKELVGYIDQGGFRADKPPTERCFLIGDTRYLGNVLVGGGSSYYMGAWLSWSQVAPLYILSADRLLEVDIRGRSTRIMLESPDLLAIGHLESWFQPDGGTERSPSSNASSYVAVRMRDHVILLEPHTGNSREYTIPADLRDVRFTFYETNDGTAIASPLAAGHAQYTMCENLLVWFDSTGKVTRRETVKVRRDSFNTDPGRERIQALMVGLLCPAPGVLGPGSLIIGPQQYLRRDETADYSSALRQFLSVFWPGLLLAALIAIVLAYVCLRRQRRFGMPGTAAWVVFVLFFGAPGFLGYLFHRRWPVREPCPACKQPVPRDREACFACGSDFPQPALKGSEVFA